MSKVTRTRICPNHGLVSAERNSTYDWPGWLVALLSGFEWTPNTPFRCPKCGRLTEATARVIRS